MAKGNLFLGTAHGSVGDVVFSRVDGEQISRVRNRSPRQTESNQQKIQQAIFATISKAYAAGKAIFDHSFEGYAAGADSQQRFMNINVERLRNFVSEDLNAGTAPELCKGAVVEEGGNSPIAMSYIVSEGTMSQPLFNMIRAQRTIFEAPAIMLVAAESNETVGEYLHRLGVQPADIFTVVVFGSKVDWYQDYEKPADTWFDFTRFFVKVSAYVDYTTLMSNATWDDIFMVDPAGAQFPMTIPCSTGTVELDMFVKHNSVVFGSMGVIRSRKGLGLRSTCIMTCQSMYPEVPLGGIKSPYILENWRAETEPVGQSELVLEGGTIPGTETQQQEDPIASGLMLRLVNYWDFSWYVICNGLGQANYIKNGADIYYFFRETNDATFRITSALPDYVDRGDLMNENVKKFSYEGHNFIPGKDSRWMITPNLPSPGGIDEILWVQDFDSSSYLYGKYIPLICYGDGSFVWPSLKINTSTIQGTGTRNWKLDNQGMLIAFDSPQWNAQAHAVITEQHTNSATGTLQANGLDILLANYNAGNKKKWDVSYFIINGGEWLDRYGVNMKNVMAMNMWYWDEVAQDMHPLVVPAGIVTPIYPDNE